MKDYKTGAESAIIYARVSTKGQASDGESLSVQKANAASYLREKGINLDTVFEEAFSGMEKKERPKFNAMLKFIREHKPGHLIYYMPDRLSRNPYDIFKLFSLCEEIEHHLVFHDVVNFDSFDVLDPKAYKKKAKLIIDTTQAGVNVKDTVLRVQESVKEKIDKGRFLGYAPVGYRNIIGRCRIDVDPVRLPLVAQAFNIFATGDYSVDDLTEIMRNKGLTVPTRKKADRDAIPDHPISRLELYRVLTNRFYIGEFKWSGKYWSNRQPDGSPSYEIHVPEEVFDKVQEALKKNRGSRMIRKGRPFLYRGLLTCRYCGCHLVGEAQGKDKQYIYYRCSYGKKFSDPDFYRNKFGTKVCPQRWWKEEEISAELMKSFDIIYPDTVTFEEFKKSLGEDIIVRHEYAKNELTLLRKERTQLQEKLDRLLLRMTEDHAPADLQDFKKLRDKLKPELEEVEDKIRELEDQDDSFVETGIATLEAARDFINFFKIKDLKSGALESDKELPFKKALLKAVIRTIICGDPDYKNVKKGEVSPYAVDIVYNEPFNYLIELPIPEEFEEEEERYRREEGRLIFSKNQKWRGRRDSNSRPPA